MGVVGCFNQPSYVKKAQCYIFSSEITIMPYFHEVLEDSFEGFISHSHQQRVTVQMELKTA